MNKHTTTAAAALVALASVASADEITQSYDYTLNGTIFTNDSFQFNSFDTMGGDRVLTDVRINIDGVFDFGLYAENLEERAITSDEWYFDSLLATTLNIAGLNTGAVWSRSFEGLTADLAANDAVEGSGDDYISWQYDGAVTNELFFIEDVFAAFETNGAGTIDGTLGIFTDIALTPPPPFFSPGFTHQLQSGTFSLTYVYDNVPSPAAASLFGIAGLAATRRQRSA